MKWRVEITPRAQHEMLNLADSIIKRIDSKIIKLSSDPFPEGSVKLKIGYGYRLRVGSWRIIYTVNSKKKEVVVYKVCHRSKAYRQN
ncbi:type II toxin-antitoxin system RelE/ParE family toxin [bacterium]|nr:type II toxin-antitoxin system RelE/ParE family toxin [bacterium]